MPLDATRIVPETGATPRVAPASGTILVPTIVLFYETCLPCRGFSLFRGDLDLCPHFFEDIVGVVHRLRGGLEERAVDDAENSRDRPDCPLEGRGTYDPDGVADGNTRPDGVADAGAGCFWCATRTGFLSFCTCMERQRMHDVKMRGGTEQQESEKDAVGRHDG